jgi:hypothetical protein
MKKLNIKLSIVMSLITLSTSVFASVCGNTGEFAFKACESTGGFQTFCERAIGNNHADERATSFCSSIPNIPDGLRYNCIKATVNKVYTIAELRTCMTSTGFKKVDCITNSGSPYISSGFSLNFGEVAQVACEDAGGFSRFCKRAVGSNHADEAAVAVCTSTVHIPDNLKYDCIKATINKTFTRGEILNCLKKKGFKRVDCISNSGDVVIPNICN